MIIDTSRENCERVAGLLQNYPHKLTTYDEKLAAMTKAAAMIRELVERVEKLERNAFIDGVQYDACLAERDKANRLAEEMAKLLLAATESDLKAEARANELHENGIRLMEAADGWKVRCDAETVIRQRVEAENATLRKSVAGLTLLLKENATSLEAERNNYEALITTLREKLRVAKEALESASCDPSAIGFDAQVALAKLEEKK